QLDRMVCLDGYAERDCVRGGRRLPRRDWIQAEPGHQFPAEREWPALRHLGHLRRSCRLLSNTEQGRARSGAALFRALLRQHNPVRRDLASPQAQRTADLRADPSRLVSRAWAAWWDHLSRIG